MNKEKYTEYIKSEEWKIRREKVLEDPYYGRPYQCLICHEKDIKRLVVHHLTYKNLFKEHDQDLCILCTGCHKNVHFFDGKRSNHNIDIKVFQIKFGVFGKPKKHKKTRKWKPSKAERKKFKDKLMNKYKIRQDIAHSLYLLCGQNLLTKDRTTLNDYLNKKHANDKQYIEKNIIRITKFYKELFEFADSN